MDKSLQTKTALVFDYGTSVELALRLSREFSRVLYYKPWKESNPTIHRLIVGDGYSEIERVRNLFDVLDEVDLAVFPDIHDGDLQLELERRGIRVWGSRNAEKYEYDRLLFKKTLKEVGLPVVPFKVCKGMTDLRRYLSESEDKWVKGDVRGDGETWHHITYALSQPKLDAMDYYYGPVKEEIRFVVDDAIETTVECAYDGYMVTSPDGQVQFPTKAFLGYENKNMAHILAITDYDKMDECVRDVNERFAPKLAAENARTQWGTEIKKTEDSHYFLDATPRAPCPPGEIVLEAVSNLGEIMWHGAAGDLVEMETEDLFGSEIMLYSSWAEHNHQPVLIPDKIRQFVKLFNCYRKDGIDWVVPKEIRAPLGGGLCQIGAVVGTGKTIEEANEAAIEVAKEIQGFDTEAQITALGECLNRIKKGEEEGIDFAGAEIPEPATVIDE